VDGRPSRRNKAAFLNFSGVVALSRGFNPCGSKAAREDFWFVFQKVGRHFRFTTLDSDFQFFFLSRSKL